MFVCLPLTTVTLKRVTNSPGRLAGPTRNDETCSKDNTVHTLIRQRYKRKKTHTRGSEPAGVSNSLPLSFQLEQSTTALVSSIFAVIVHWCTIQSIGSVRSFAITLSGKTYKSGDTIWGWLRRSGQLHRFDLTLNYTHSLNHLEYSNFWLVHYTG